MYRALILCGLAALAASNAAAVEGAAMLPSLASKMNVQVWPTSAASIICSWNTLDSIQAPLP